MSISTPTLYASLSWFKPSWTKHHFEVFWEEFKDLDNPFASAALSFASESLKLTKQDVIDTLKKSEQILEKDQSRGVTHICVVDSDYPRALKSSVQPPLILSVLGSTSCLHRQGIGIVGARRLSEVSKWWLESEFFDFLSKTKAREQFSVYSGGATGIDQLSHQLALVAGCSCVAVLPTGLSQVYPQSFHSLASQIVSRGGAVVSPFAPHQQVRKYLFHYRNQVLAASVQSLIIVQASARSGTLLSANMAMTEGKDIYVVPGHPSQPAFQGNLNLIFDGATIIRDARDLESFLV